MRTEQYKQWLELQQYQANTIAAQMHRAGRVEEYFGDLDTHYEADRLASVSQALAYTMTDRRNNRPNPTPIPFDGDPYNNLASYRDAVNRYRRFRADAELNPVEPVQQIAVTPSVTLSDEDNGQRIGLERDMQAALRARMVQLENGLTVIDDGAERSVESGFIDITARDSTGVTVVIELKTGVAGQRAVAQILSYMGDMVYEQDGARVRGILIAADFDARARSAARMVPDLTLRKYSVRFLFTDVSE